jgi:hypothetical protein
MVAERPEPTVSAVIPVHNGARFVAESIASVLAQTHPVMECIVVDDGSTDATAEVLADFGDRVVVVRQEALGVAAARNAGMDKAGGDYFAFLDADDVWFPGKIAAQLAALRATPDAGAAYTGFVLTDEHLAWRRVVLHAGGPGSLRRAFLGYSPGLGFSFTGVVDRRVVDKAGGFDERLGTCADSDFWHRLSTVRPVIGVRRPLAAYRQHPYGQMHLDVEATVRETAVVWEAAGVDLDSPTARRARAHLEAHVGAQLLQRGQAAGLDHLRLSARYDWRPLAAMPFVSAGRRVVQSVLARALAPRPPAGGA